MNKRSRGLPSTLGIGLLLILVLLLIALVRNVPGRIQPGQAEPPVAQAIDAVKPDSPLPTPFTPVVIEAPTWTPWPTWTPRPTPTKSVVSTPEPFPTRPPASDAHGSIYFSELQESQVHIKAFSVNNRGQKLEDVVELPITFSPILGTVSPNGHYLIVVDPQFPVGIPYVYESRTKMFWKVFQNQPENQEVSGIEYGWHPNSKQILFWSFNSEELWLVDIQSGQQTYLATVNGAPPQGASVSPDGQSIIYGENSQGIKIVSSAGGDSRLLFEVSTPYLFGWSPDGKNILYMGGPGNTDFPNKGTGSELNSTLWLLDSDGQNPRPVPGSFISGWSFQPKWSPDSQWIAFTGLDASAQFGCTQKNNESPDRCRFKGAAIYLTDITSGTLQRLASGIEPVWSPDGSMLAFLSDQDGAPNIWTIQRDGSGLQSLTNTIVNNQKIIWSVEGGE